MLLIHADVGGYVTKVRPLNVRHLANSIKYEIIYHLSIRWTAH